MLPCDNYRGFRDPLGNVAFLCDALVTCWLGVYSTPADYNSCVTSANATISACNLGCAPGDDGSAAAAAKASCDDGCNDTADGCNTVCQSTFDACVGPCDPPGPGTDCYSACLASKIDCQQDCHDNQGDCLSGCSLNYQITVAGIAPADAFCLSACCSSKPDHISACQAPCNDEYNSANTDAQVAYWTCVSGCELIFWDGDVFIYNSACVSGCDVTRQASVGDATNEKTLCLFDCQADYDNQWTDCGANYRCSRQCISDNQDAVLLCTLASAGGGSQSTFAHCLNDAAEALLRCNLDCCFNLNGRNLFDVAAIECVVTKGGCLTDIVDGCPAPGTGPGDPCEHPGSDACTEALAAQAACTAAATIVCNTAFKGCIEDITEPNKAACGGCLGDFLFPTDDE